MTQKGCLSHPGKGQIGVSVGKNGLSAVPAGDGSPAEIPWPGADATRFWVIGGQVPSSLVVLRRVDTSIHFQACQASSPSSSSCPPIALALALTLACPGPGLTRSLFSIFLSLPLRSLEPRPGLPFPHARPIVHTSNIRTSVPSIRHLSLSIPPSPITPIELFCITQVCSLFPSRQQSPSRHSARATKFQSFAVARAHRSLVSDARPIFLLLAWFQTVAARLAPLPIWELIP